MAIRNLVRVGAWAMLVGGFVLIAHTLIHPDDTVAGGLTSPLFPASHILGAVAYLLLVVGLVGVYILQGDANGKLGLVAFLVALTGTVLTTGLVLDEAFFLTDLAIRVPEVKTLSDSFQQFTGALAAYPLVLLTGLLLYALGYILVGITIWRANVLPRWIGIALVVGVVLSFGSFVGSYLAHQVGGVLFGIGIAWLGYAMLISKRAAMMLALAQAT